MTHYSSRRRSSHRSRRSHRSRSRRSRRSHSHSHSRSRSRSPRLSNDGTRKFGGSKSSMGADLAAWNKRMAKIYKVAPISKATQAAAKPAAPPSGSAQRHASGQHVAAQARGMNASSTSTS